MADGDDFDSGPMTAYEEIELLDWAYRKVHEHNRPRVYVTFVRDNGEPFTVGPVLSVDIGPTTMAANSGSSDASCRGHRFTLATFDGDGWHVNGAEFGPCRGWRLSTQAPEET